MDDQHVGHRRHQRNRREVLHRVERELLLDYRVDRVRQRDKHQRVTVRGRVCGEFGADEAASSAPVVDHHLLAHELCHALCHHA